jgi:hypothetical protein
MSRPRFEMENLYEIWDNDCGGLIEIGPDRDGLGLIEIRYKNEQGKIVERMSFDKEQLKLVVEALSHFIDKN